MPTLPSAEDSARRILAVYMQKKCRLGHILGERDFFLNFGGGGFQNSDFKPGMEYALDQKWVEKTPKGYELTGQGFSEA